MKTLLRTYANFSFIYGLVLVLLFGFGCQNQTKFESESNSENNLVSPSVQSDPLDLAIINISPDPKDATRVTLNVTIKDVNLKSEIEALEIPLDSLLSFSLISEAKASPILGEYTLQDNKIQFQPSFSLIPGEAYLARLALIHPAFKQSQSPRFIEKIYRVPAGLQPKIPRVHAIYPSGNQLPANHLKFYVLFSEPMQQGDIYSYFSLFNSTKNQPVVRPFRHTELWSDDGKQLTLWFHPGRQKKGVNLNVELGPILSEGDNYTLTISQQWPALSGANFLQNYTKHFQAIAPDSTQPDLSKWRDNTPSMNTLEAYTCLFPEPLDWALLKSKLYIINNKGENVPGINRPGREEKSFEFIPEKPWQAGTYHLIVDALLEDLAGNSLLRPFAVDLSREDQRNIKPAQEFKMSFHISENSINN